MSAGEPGDAAELEALRRQVDELRRELAAAREAEASLRESEWRLRRLMEVTNETIALFEKGIIVDVSQHFAAMFRCRAEDAIGRSAIEFTAPESRELLAHNMRTGYAEAYEATLLRADGTTFSALIRGRLIDHGGRPLRVSAILDITSRKEAERALRERAVHEEVITAQAALLASLSTPLLPIAEGVLVLPLIGDVSPDRAAQVLEALTRGVADHGARAAILDITGVNAVDARVAELLVRSARAAALLGARVLLTGVRPEVARTLVELGADLGGVATYGSLRQGVTAALGRP